MYTTYPQPQNYGPQHNGVQGYGYAPMPQQPMPVAAPVAQSAASKGLLMIAGLAVVGAAAFGGVYLMNSSQPEQTAASQPSTVFNIPSEINIPGLNTHSDPASSPVVVNNPAPVRVFTPSAPSSNTTSTAPVQQQAPAVPGQTPANTGTTTPDTKPADTKPAETGKPADTKPADTKPAETGKPADTKPADTGKPADTKPADTGKPADTKPADTGKPADTKPADTGKPADTNAGGGATAGGGFPDVDVMTEYGGCACGNK